MAASGNYTLAMTVNDAAMQSYSLLQVAESGEDLDGDMQADFKVWGNLVLKNWQTQANHLWAKTEGTLFLKNNEKTYDFRLATTKLSNEWFETTTTANTLALAYTFLVTSISDIQKNDTIGILQNDNDIFWTTVTRVSGLTVTVKDPITLTTVSGAYVRNFRDVLKPISRITQIRRKEGDDYEIPIIKSSRSDYYGLPNKDQAGTPIQAYYDRQDVAGDKYGIMKIWSPPISSVPVINFTYERKLQVMTGPDETLDIPEYAQQAFIFNVAVKLAFKYGASPERLIRLKEEAFTLLNDALSFDSDNGPIEIKLAYA